MDFCNKPFDPCSSLCSTQVRTTLQALSLWTIRVRTWLSIAADALHLGKKLFVSRRFGETKCHQMMEITCARKSAYKDEYLRTEGGDCSGGVLCANSPICLDEVV
jgi:hypothetical protein